jgi:hypothetical protein
MLRGPKAPEIIDSQPLPRLAVKASFLPISIRFLCVYWECLILLKSVARIRHRLRCITMQSCTTILPNNVDPVS